MDLDLLLVNPCSSNPHPMIPLGLASLAAVAREAGGSVRALDAWAEGRRTPGALRRRLEEFPRPRIVGVSVLTPNLQGAADTVAVARSVFPDALLVLGGPHVSAMPQQVLLDFPAADLAVYGEGEMTLREILVSGADARSVPVGLPGTIRREGPGVVVAPPREPIPDLDALPRPARDLFPLDRYHPHPPYGRRWRYMNEITSRGCPFHCAYCSKSVFGNSYRAFSPERVVADLRELAARFQVREIHFYDDDLTLHRKRTVAILEQLAATGLDLIWSCTTRCDLVDAELLRLMKKAGCWMISYGVESGNDAVRDTIRKGVSREQIEAAFRYTREAGIQVTGYFMIGLPGETEETVRETIAFADRLRADYVNWAVMTVYPGSPFYVDIQQGRYGPGRLVRKETASDPLSQSPFQDAFLQGFEGALSRARMEELLRIATRHFYLRPAALWRTLRNIRSFRQLGSTLRTGLGMIRWLLAARPGAVH